MLWFLRLFAAFRLIESRLAVAEQEVEFYRTQAAGASERLMQLSERMSRSAEDVADAMSFRLLGRAIYRNASSLPAPEPTAPPAEHRRMLPSQARRQATQKTVDELRKFFEEEKPQIQ